MTATEGLTGLSGAASVEIAAPSAARALRSAVGLRNAASVAKFAARKPVALTIALTPEQARDGKIGEQARALEAFYRKQGRTVSIGSVAPGGVVESLQPLRSPHRFPQWKTVAADLVLFGTAANNVLLLDETRAEIFPVGLATPAPGAAEVVLTRSPFVGEYDALNVIAADAAGMAAAVRTIVAQGKVADK